MNLNTKRRKVLTTFFICLVILSELVHFNECDKTFMKIMKLAKKAKKLKKFLPLLLLGPKILIIKSG